MSWKAYISLLLMLLLSLSLFLLYRLEDDWEEFAELVQEIEADQNYKEIKRIEVVPWKRALQEKPCRALYLGFSSIIKP